MDDSAGPVEVVPMLNDMVGLLGLVLRCQSSGSGGELDYAGL